VTSDEFGRPRRQREGSCLPSRHRRVRLLSRPAIPADGTTLGEAFWRVVDRRGVDREASDRLQSIPPEHRSSVAENVALRVAVRRFCDLMQNGKYRATGRRGSPTAEHSEIPRTAWPYLDLFYWQDSEPAVALTGLTALSAEAIQGRGRNSAGCGAQKPPAGWWGRWPGAC
jgi:hypothetical protein